MQPRDERSPAPFVGGRASSALLGGIERIDPNRPWADDQRASEAMAGGRDERI